MKQQLRISFVLIGLAFLFIQSSLPTAVTFKLTASENLLYNVELLFTNMNVGEYKIHRSTNKGNVFSKEKIRNTFNSNGKTLKKHDKITYKDYVSKEYRGKDLYYGIEIFSNGKAIQSNTAKGFTAAMAYHFPASLYKIKIDYKTNKAKLSWTAMLNATAYEIQIVTKNPSNWNDSLGYQNHSNLIFNTIVSSNNFDWEIPERFIGETEKSLFWTVQPIFDTRKGVFSQNGIISINEETRFGNGSNSPFIIETFRFENSQYTFSKKEDEYMKFNIRLAQQNNNENAKVLFFISTDNQWSKDDKKIAEEKIIFENRSIINSSRYFTTSEMQRGRFYLLVVPAQGNNVYVSQSVVKAEEFGLTD